MWNFLLWPNRFEGKLTQDLDLVGDYNPIEFPDQDTEIQLVMSISLAQFTKLYSSIIKGAILSYPDEYEQIAWTFLKAFEMPYDICQLIADCIDNPESPARQAVKNLVINDNDITQHIINVSGPGSPMTGPQIEALIGDECDEDAAFGGWSALIRQMDTNNRDLFERIEIGTNQLERANIAISAIPAIGMFPADEIFDFLNELIDNLTENYVAQWTTTLEDEMRCDLFCLALDNECGLTFDNVFEYFNDRLAASFTVESLFLDILSFIGAGAWSGTQIVDAMMLLQVAVLRHASKYLDFVVPSLQLTYQLGLNDPDPDWSTLCDCTPPPGCDGDDLTTGTQGWLPLNDSSTEAVYHTGEGYGKGVGGSVDRLGIYNVFGPASSITITFNAPTTGTVDVGNGGYAYPPNLGSIVHGTPTTEWTLAFSPVSGSIYFEFRVGVSDPIPDTLRVICVKVE